MKKFLLGILIVLFGVQSAYAVATVPSKSLWITPDTAKTGEAIELNALVYNDTNASFTATVTFSTAGGVIGTASNVVVESKSAKAATVTWKMPADSTLITATITKATTTSKKDLPALQGIIGTITIGGPIPTTEIHGFVGKIVNALEQFRLRNLAHFTTLLAASEAKLGKITAQEIGAFLAPAPAPSAPTNADVPTATSTVETQKTSDHNTMEYVTFGYAVAGKAFFAHKVLYYIILILLTLGILRFIFSKLL